MNIKQISKLVILSSALGSSLICQANGVLDVIRDAQGPIVIDDLREILKLEVAKAELKSTLESKGLYDKVNASLYVNSLEDKDVLRLKNFFGRDTSFPYLGRVLSDDGILKSHEVIAWAKLQEEVEAATGTITWGTSVRKLDENGEVVTEIVRNFPTDLEGNRSSSSKVMRSIILRNLADDKFGALSFEQLINRLNKINSQTDWIEVYEGRDESTLEDLLELAPPSITLSPYAIAWARSVDSSRTAIAWAIDANIENSSRAIAWAVESEYTNVPTNSSTYLDDVERDLERELERIRDIIDGPLINVINDSDRN
ncbi:hypothetical protein [Halobacteriovorax sp. HLS]|uniref:hypothetical protein n=1 Tax=Halobacteriovorax sp. HLS TaxID=2234000 RepID=UPI000FD7A2D7|nr:hypothetical protein [Halobacteriovorax sp. HLS]